MLKGSVGAKKNNGKKSENIMSDVITVQLLLNHLIALSPKMKVLEPLTANGIVSNNQYDPTIVAIIFYQRHILNFTDKKVTGRIDPGDPSFKTLLGEVGGIALPDPLAPIEDRIMWKLKQARESDKIYYYNNNRDPKGQMTCMLKKLVDNPKVDDSYLDKNGVRNYIDFSPSDRPPKPVQTITLSVKGFIKLWGMKKTVDGIFELLIDLRECIRDGIRETYQTDEWTRQAITGIDKNCGPGFAVIMVENWLKKHRDNKNSIYSCFKAEWEE